VPYSARSVGGVLISLSYALSPQMDKPLKSVRRQTYGYFPSRTASSPLDRYHVILLGDRGACV